jgi:hypothetical protein
MVHVPMYVHLGPYGPMGRCGDKDGIGPTNSLALNGVPQPHPRDAKGILRYEFFFLLSAIRVFCCDCFVLVKALGGDIFQLSTRRVRCKRCHTCAQT